MVGSVEGSKTLCDSQIWGDSFRKDLCREQDGKVTGDGTSDDSSSSTIIASDADADEGKIKKGLSNTDDLECKQHRRRVGDG